jgi:hypothetical protein
MIIYILYHIPRSIMTQVLVSHHDDDKEKGDLDSLYESKRFLITYKDNQGFRNSYFIKHVLDLDL